MKEHAKGLLKAGLSLLLQCNSMTRHYYYDMQEKTDTVDKVLEGRLVDQIPHESMS